MLEYPRSSGSAKCEEAAVGVPPELQALMPPGEFVKCGREAEHSLYCDKDKRTYRMCNMCAHHNLKRGMIEIEEVIFKGKVLRVGDEMYDDLNKFTFLVSEEWAVQSIIQNPKRFTWPE